MLFVCLRPVVVLTPQPQLWAQLLRAPEAAGLQTGGMELSLTRQELLQVSSTCRKTMRLLPLGKKKQQKVVVGDSEGVVQCFGMKKDGVVETIFKTPPGEREVGRIELAGAGGKSDASGEEPIKIFYASGGTVRGLLRKGKEFLRFNTNLTEPIRSMFVQDDHIYTGGEYIYNHFVQLKDTAFFMSNDRINDLTCEFVSSESRQRGADAVLACQDRMIRVLTGSELLYEASIDGPAVTIERYHNPQPSAGGPSQGFGPSSPGAPATHACMHPSIHPPKHVPIRPCIPATMWVSIRVLCACAPRAPQHVPRARVCMQAMRAPRTHRTTAGLRSYCTARRTAGSVSCCSIRRCCAAGGRPLTRALETADPVC